MKLFNSILDAGVKPASPGDKRKLPRYTVGADFPLKTKLMLFQNGGGKTELKGKDWTAATMDLSTTGASVQLSLAAVASQRESCVLKFSLGGFLLDIPATVAHFRCGSQYSLCGVLFNFPHPEVQQAYLQLLEPVAIGSSLVPVEATLDMPGQHKEQFAGASSTLCVWRDKPKGPIKGFELQMHRYVLRWVEGLPELEIFGIGEMDSSVSADADPSYFELSAVQHEEVRWLFCLAVPNLSKSVPLDVRQFLATLVA